MQIQKTIVEIKHRPKRTTDAINHPIEGSSWCWKYATPVTPAVIRLATNNIPTTTAVPKNLIKPPISPLIFFSKNSKKQFLKMTDAAIAAEGLLMLCVENGTENDKSNCFASFSEQIILQRCAALLSDCAFSGSFGSSARKTRKVSRGGAFDLDYNDRRCNTCGRTETPQWRRCHERKGAWLCNSCGLRSMRKKLSFY
jgi:hypothetical protein